jgi:hypothetical protein
VEYTTIDQAAPKSKGMDEEPAEQSIIPTTNDDVEVDNDIDDDNLDVNNDDAEVDDDNLLLPLSIACAIGPHKSLRTSSRHHLCRGL